MRFDGTLGFPGGIADKGETPEMAVNREMSECSSADKFTITPADHLSSKISCDQEQDRRFCLHSYTKEISLESLQQLEKSTYASSDYGHKVIAILGNIYFVTWHEKTGYKYTQNTHVYNYYGTYLLFHI